MQVEASAPQTNMGYRKAAAFLASMVLIAAVVTIAVNQGIDTQDLAKAKKATPLKFGAKITLMTTYNEYIVTDRKGSVSMNGFSYGDNTIKIINPHGKKGAVKYGAAVSLMGPNGKYFLAHYSGKISSRAEIIAKDSQFIIQGGSGAVQIGDRVSFKNEFGYLTVDEDGANSLATRVTVMQKYLIGLPGQENGLKLATGVTYGEVVTFHNSDNQFLQIDHNGWGTIHGHPDGNWDHFAILSNEHRDGHVSYGDRIVLRAHNGRFVSIREDNRAVEAVSRSITEQGQFRIIGAGGTSSGYVHARDKVMLQAAEGYLEAIPLGGDIRAVTAPSEHTGPQTEWVLQKIWDNQL
jgi:hypothetical protein